jgi:hypothetical protein
MFRFSIRELVLVTLVVGLALAWGLDRHQLRAELTTAKKVAGEAMWKLTLSENSNKNIVGKLKDFGLYRLLDLKSAEQLYEEYAASSPMTFPPPSSSAKSEKRR